MARPSTPPRPSRRWLLWLLFLCAGSAALFAVAALVLETRGRPPRLLGPYLERRASGHNPIIVAIGERLDGLFTWLDRGSSPVGMPVIPWVAAPAAPPPAKGATTVLVGSADELAAAIRQAQPGDVITLLPGSYRFVGPSIPVNRPGREGAPITVRAEVPGTARLEFNIVEGFHVTAPWWVFENLHIQGVCTNHSDCEHAFHVVGKGSHFVARNNTLLNFNAHFKINGEGAQPDNGLIVGNVLRNTAVRATTNPVTPIDLVGASNWTVRGNLIADFVKGQGDGISYGAFAKGAGSNNHFVANTVVCEHLLRDTWGQRVGLSLGGGGTAPGACRDGRCVVEQEGSLIESNLVAACSDAGIYLNRAAQSRLRHNTLLDTGGVLLRFAETSADLDGNLVDGAVQVADGAILRKGDNRVSSMTRLYLGSHPVRALFHDALAFDLGWAGEPPRRAEPAAQVADLCGGVRQTAPTYGAFEDIRGCLKH